MEKDRGLRDCYCSRESLFDFWTTGSRAEILRSIWKMWVLFVGGCFWGFEEEMWGKGFGIIGEAFVVEGSDEFFY